MGNFLDGLIAGVQRVYHSGVAKPKRPNLNFASGFTATDNPGTDSIDLTASGGAAADGVATVSALKALLSGAYVDKQVRVVNNLALARHYDTTAAAGKAGDGYTYDKPTDVGTPGTGAWIAHGTPTLPTFADLANANGGFHSRVHVLGYYAPGDGGGGVFVWQTTTAPNSDGGTIVKISTNGWWQREYSGALKVVWFGARFDCKSAINIVRNDGSHTVGALTAGTWTQADVGKVLCLQNATANLTGTVTLTLGSPNVAGAGTAFLTELAGCTHLWAPDGNFYTIDHVTSNTALVLTANAVANSSGTTAHGDAMLVTVIVTVNGPGDSCTVAASGASIHKQQNGNARACWGTDDGPAFTAAMAACPVGGIVEMPSGETMLPGGLLLAKPLNIWGAGSVMPPGAAERGSYAWLEAGQSRGTVLRMCSTLGLTFSGALLESVNIKGFTVLGSGLGTAVGVDFSTAGAVGVNSASDVLATNWGGAGWNLTNSLDSYHDSIFAFACATGIRGSIAASSNNDIHIWGGFVENCDIGIDTTGLSSVHFHGVLHQNNKLGDNWGNCDCVYIHDSWYENNTVGWAINSVGAGSIINSGYINCRAGGDVFTQPAPVITSAGVQGFQLRGHRADGATLNFAGMGDTMLDNCRLGNVDMSTLPTGMAVRNSMLNLIGGFSTAVSMDATQVAASVYTYAATVTPTWKRGEICYVTLTNNITIAEPTDAPAGAKMTLILQQDGTGGRTVALNAAFKGTWTPHLGASGVASMTFWKLSASNWLPLGGLP